MRTKLIWLLAIAVIGFGVYGVLDSQKIKEPVVIEVPKVVLWQLKAPVSDGDVVSRQDMTQVTMLLPEAEQIGFSQSVELKWSQGAVYRRDLVEGAYLTNEHFIDVNHEDYVNHVLEEGKFAYTLNIPAHHVKGGNLYSGDLVDVLALFGTEQSPKRIAGGRSVLGLKAFALKPVMTGVKVLRVNALTVDSADGDKMPTGAVSVILELSRKQASRLTIAEEVSVVQLHRSNGEYSYSELNASGEDLIHDSNIIEFHGSKQESRE